MIKKFFIFQALFVSLLYTGDLQAQKSDVKNTLHDLRRQCLLMGTKLSRGVPPQSNGPLIAKPQRIEILTEVYKLIPSLMVAKGKPDEDAWIELSRMGDGNCGECVGYLQESLELIFGKENVKVHVNDFSFADKPRGKNHAFFTIQSYDKLGNPSEELIVDYSWLQWFSVKRQGQSHSLPDGIQKELDLIFVGSSEKLYSTLSKHKKWLEESWLQSEHFSFYELFKIIYSIEAKVEGSPYAHHSHSIQETIRRIEQPPASSLRWE